MKPFVSHLKVFGCVSYAFVESHHISVVSWMENLRNVFSLDIVPQSKTYRLYNPLSGKIITSRNIVFDEEASWDWNEAMQPKIPSLDLIDLSPTETLPHSTSSESSPAITPNDCSTSSSSSEQTSSSYENETPPRKFRSL